MFSPPPPYPQLLNEAGLHPPNLRGCESFHRCLSSSTTPRISSTYQVFSCILGTPYTTELQIYAKHIRQWLRGKKIFLITNSIHLVHFKGAILFFIYQWKKLEINFPKKQWMANKCPWKSQSHIVRPRKEEGQDRLHPLSWVSSNTGSTQGWREKATFKRSMLLNEAFTILLPKSTRWGTCFLN